MENKDLHYIIFSLSISSLRIFLGVFYIQKRTSALLVALY